MIELRVIEEVEHFGAELNVSFSRNRMRNCRIMRLSPSGAAAPSGPPTWPLACSSAAKIFARSGLGVPGCNAACKVTGRALPLLRAPAPEARCRWSE
jgi:hypothetical protein